MDDGGNEDCSQHGRNGPLIAVTRIEAAGAIHIEAACAIHIDAISAVR
jgi:hypothetical protein